MTSKAWKIQPSKIWRNGSGENWKVNVPASARSWCTKPQLPAACIAANNKEGLGSYPKASLTAGKPPLLVPTRSLTTRWRSASSCCREWGAGCREVRPLFSCCRGTLRVPGGWQYARRRREFVRRCAASRRSRTVATRRATGFLRGALSHRSCLGARAPLRIQLRFAIREHCPAMSNQAAFEKHPVKCPALVCLVVEKIVSQIGQSAAECLLCVFGEEALQFGKCLGGSTNPSASGSPRVPGQRADWSTLSRGSLLSLFARCQAADTRVPGARAKSASADLPAYLISRREKVCRRLPLQSSRENRAWLP